MNKLIFLLLAITVACSSGDNENQDIEETKCLTCSNVGFEVLNSWNEISICDYELNVCVGDEYASVCFPDGVPNTAGQPPLTLEHINLIKAFWESNGSTCVLNP